MSLDIATSGDARSRSRTIFQAAPSIWQEPIDCNGFKGPAGLWLVYLLHDLLNNALRLVPTLFVGYLIALAFDKGADAQLLTKLASLL